MHPAVQHLAESIDNDRPHAGKPFGQRVGPQQHHGAGNVLGQRFADSHRVGAYQVHLKLANVLARNTHVGEVADPVLTA